jgi:hypothetical protein
MATPQPFQFEDLHSESLKRYLKRDALYGNILLSSQHDLHYLLNSKFNRQRRVVLCANKLSVLSLFMQLLNMPRLAGGL